MPAHSHIFVASIVARQQVYCKGCKTIDDNIEAKSKYAEEIIIAETLTCGSNTFFSPMLLDFMEEVVGDRDNEDKKEKGLLLNGFKEGPKSFAAIPCPLKVEPILLYQEN